MPFSARRSSSSELIVGLLMALCLRRDAILIPRARKRENAVLSFAKCLLEVIPERLYEIVDRAALGCQDISFRRHAGNQRGTFGKLGQLALAKRDLGQVVGCAGAFV